MISPTVSLPLPFSKATDLPPDRHALISTSVKPPPSGKKYPHPQIPFRAIESIYGFPIFRNLFCCSIPAVVRPPGSNLNHCRVFENLHCPLALVLHIHLRFQAQLSPALHPLRYLSSPSIQHTFFRKMGQPRTESFRRGLVTPFHFVIRSSFPHHLRINLRSGMSASASAHSFKSRNVY